MSGKAPSNLPSALDLVPELAAKAAERPVAVFLDFDGTLSPIVERPAEARLSAAMREALRELGSRCPVYVVSGRNLADVRARVDLPGIGYAGSHGFDFAAADGQEWHHPDAMGFMADLDGAEAGLREQLSAVRGIEIERKRFSVAVHFRRANPSEIATIEVAVNEVLDRHRRLTDVPGKMVHDLRPDLSWDKGRSVLWMLDRLGLSGGRALPVYVGDDITDEDAFAAVERSGIGIRVGDPDAASHAKYMLRDADEVLEFLEVLSAALPD